jgi:hypothetical protein
MHMPYGPGVRTDVWAAVCGAGNMAPDAREAALVAMSFARANTDYLHQRYLQCNTPRRRRAGDWLVGLSDVARQYSGSSLGAAIAGACWGT